MAMPNEQALTARKRLQDLGTDQTRSAVGAPLAAPKPPAPTMGDTRPTGPTTVAPPVPTPGAPQPPKPPAPPPVQPMTPPSPPVGSVGPGAPLASGSGGLAYLTREQPDSQPGGLIGKVGSAVPNMIGAPKAPAPLPPPPAPVALPSAAPVVAPNAGLQTTMAAASPATPASPAPYSPANVQYDAQGMATPDDKPDGLISGDSRYNKALDRWESVDLYNARQNVPQTEGEKRASVLAGVPEAERAATMQALGWTGAGQNINSDGTRSGLTNDQEANRAKANAEAQAILSRPAEPVPPPTPPTQPPLPPPQVDPPPPPPSGGPTTGTPPSPPNSPTPPPPLPNSLVDGGSPQLPPQLTDVQGIVPEQDLRGKAILPSENGVDRFSLMRDRLKAFDEDQAAVAEQQRRSLLKGGAALGRLGSGMLRTDFGNLASDLQRQRRTFGTNALADATEGTIGDARSNRAETRGERSYQNDMESQAYNRRLNQYNLEQDALERKFNRGIRSAEFGYSGNPSGAYGGAASQAAANAAQQQSSLMALLAQMGRGAAGPVPTSAPQSGGGASSGGGFDFGSLLNNQSVTDLLQRLARGGK